MGLPPLFAGGLNATVTAPAAGVEPVNVGAPWHHGRGDASPSVPKLLKAPVPTTLVARTRQR